VKTTPEPSTEEIRIIREDLDPDGRYTGQSE
jgi:glutaconate CoA-transferase, subunit B